MVIDFFVLQLHSSALIECQKIFGLAIFITTKSYVHSTYVSRYQSVGSASHYYSAVTPSHYYSLVTASCYCPTVYPTLTIIEILVQNVKMCLLSVLFRDRLAQNTVFST